MRIPANSDLRETSAFWFIRDHPKKGQTANYLQIDFNRMGWKTVKETYLGDEKITLHGHRIKAHKVLTSAGLEWLDNRGLPYRLEYSGARKTVFVRT